MNNLAKHVIPNNSSPARLHALAEINSEKVKILGRDKPQTLSIKVATEHLENAGQDLLSGDSDLTVEYLKDCNVSAEELAARALACRYYLNSGNGPRELFNVSELANFFSAHAFSRKEEFKKLEKNSEEISFNNQLLRQLMGFSSLHSWQQIVSEIGEKTLIVHHNASLASSLIYLGNKGVLPKLDQPPIFADKKNFLKSITKESVLIFDPMLEDLLLSNELFRNACIRNKVKVLVPVGLHKGITAYGTDLESIPAKLEDFRSQIAESSAAKGHGRFSEISDKAHELLYQQTIADFQGRTGLECLPIFPQPNPGKEISRVFADQISQAAFEPEMLRKCLELSPGYQDPELRYVLNSC